jgi:hypothetical protein
MAIKIEAGSQRSMPMRAIITMVGETVAKLLFENQGVSSQRDGTIDGKLPKTIAKVSIAASPSARLTNRHEDEVCSDRTDWTFGFVLIEKQSEYNSNYPNQISFRLTS